MKILLYRFILKMTAYFANKWENYKIKLIINSFPNDQLIIGKKTLFIGVPVFRIQIGSTIRFGTECLINSTYHSNPAGVVIPSTFATIKEGATINIANNVGISGASIVAATRITIEDHVQIGAGVCIWDNDFHPIDPDARIIHKTNHFLTKEIHIGRNVFIGARSLILKGVSIGENAVIGAGSVVIKDIPPNCIFAGNPAHLIKKLDK